MRGTTCSVTDAQSRGVGRAALTVSDGKSTDKFAGNAAELAAEFATLAVSGGETAIPRIVEVDPIAAVGLEALRDDVVAAAIDLALDCVYYVYPKPFATKLQAQTNCRKCGAMAEAGLVLMHKPGCAVGLVMAYVWAVNDARMGVERRPERRSLLPQRELHIKTRKGDVVDHAEAAAAHAAETPWPVAPVVFDLQKYSLTFSAFQKLNALRSNTCFGRADDRWTLNDWAVALAGEVGELCNLLKKNRRGLATDERFALDGPFHELALHNLLSELADVITYADRMITELGADTAEVVMEKFDAVSRRVGFEIPVDFSI